MVAQRGLARAEKGLVLTEGSLELSLKTAGRRARGIADLVGLIVIDITEQARQGPHPTPR